MKNFSVYLICLAVLTVVVASSANQGVLKARRHLEGEPSNEIDDSIKISEPYKSMLETTARFALAQTKVTDVLNIDTAVRLLGDLAALLLKPTILVQLIRVAAIAFTALFTTTFFFPSSYRYMETVWKDPYNALNLDRYMSNGISEGSVLTLLNSKTDEALSRVGLSDSRCQEQSVCHFGEILRCSFPQMSEAMIKFASDNFSNVSMRDLTFMRAFNSGFMERNCSRIADESRNSPSCLNNFINSMLSNPRATNTSRNGRRSF